MKEKNNKKKSGIVKKIFLVIAALLLVWFTTDLIVTEIYASKIPHHFASAKEGKELMLSNTEYYANVTQVDIDNRMGRSGATLDELLEASTAEVKSFNIFEKYIITSGSRMLPRPPGPCRGIPSRSARKSPCGP